MEAKSKMVTLAGFIDGESEAIRFDGSGCHRHGVVK